MVSFDFRFLTTEWVNPPDVNFLDFAFVAIDGAIVKLADLTSGFTAAPAASGYTSITFGPGSVAIAGLSAGSHTFGFGVVDVGDVSFVAIGDSGLILDALRSAATRSPSRRAWPCSPSACSASRAISPGTASSPSPERRPERPRGDAPPPSDPSRRPPSPGRARPPD